MNQKIVVKEDRVRGWIKKALVEFGTVPDSESKAPIKPKRTDVIDSGDSVPLKLSPYRGAAEKRPPPRSTKSTRSERGMDPEDLQKISSGLRSQKTEIEGKVWDQDDLYIPERRGLGISGVRKELETGSDKIQLSHSTPELVIQMFERAVKDYKELLRGPLKIVQAGLREYVKDLESTGELDRADIKELKSPQGQAALASSRGFQEFFKDWIQTDAPAQFKTIHRRTEPMWFGSVFTMARAGTLNLDDPTPALRSLSEDFLLETSYCSTLTIVERALVLRDPGFRYYVGGLGGKHVYYWDWVRNTAEKKGLYTGQY